MMKKKLIVVIIFLSLIGGGVVYAQETGYALDIANSNANINTSMSNSTVVENVTLSNGALTLNINADNVSSVTINGVNYTATQSTPNNPLPSKVESIVPLNITSAPSWIDVEPVGMFNDFMVSMTPSTYTVRITITDPTYYQSFKQLYNTNMTSVFPNEFYTDFGLIQNVYPFGNASGSEFTIAFSSNSKHLTNSYLPDPPNDNSGEKLLYQAIEYYLSQTLQNER
jgi:hypothetical protein